MLNARIGAPPARGSREQLIPDLGVFDYPTLAECYRVAALNGLNKIRNI